MTVPNVGQVRTTSTGNKAYINHFVNVLVMVVIYLSFILAGIEIIWLSVVFGWLLGCPYVLTLI